MFRDRLKIFTDRQEPIALFDYLRGRDPTQPWPLLPILTFIGVPGSGKSLLINYLRLNRCSLNERQAAIPFAYLDFTSVDAPKDLFSILVALREQLQQKQ